MIRAIILAIAFAVGVCAPPANSAPQVDSAPVVVDEYPSEPEPSGIRGLTVGELLRDAWESESALGVGSPDTALYVMLPEYVASYDGEPAAFPESYFYVHSTTLPGVHHVFRWTTAQKA